MTPPRCSPDSCNTGTLVRADNGPCMKLELGIELAWAMQQRQSAGELLIELTGISRKLVVNQAGNLPNTSMTGTMYKTKNQFDRIPAAGFHW